MYEYFRSISAVIFILIKWRVGLWEQILFWIEESHWKKSWQWPDKSQSCPAWSIPTICFSSSSRFIAPSWVKIKNNPNHLFLFQVKLKCTCSYERILSHLKFHKACEKVLSEIENDFYLYPSIHDKLYSDYELKTPEAEDMDFMKRIQIKFP